MTKSQARNAIKRALKALVDPVPKVNEKKKVWDYFENKCAFCGLEMNRAERVGHIDHLIPESKGGKNALVNRVLSCSTCNGDEKLDQDWKEFLEYKCPESSQFLERKKCIEVWVERNGGEPVLSESVLAKLEVEFSSVNAAFTNACGRVTGAI